MTKTVKIALLGCGTVGTEVARLLHDSGAEYGARSGGSLELIGIAVRDTAVERDPVIDPALLTTDAQSLISAADLVIELIGGIEPPLTYVLAALEQGKTVVTGNKALIATHGPQLWEAARRGRANLYFEAAVAGAVPVVYGLRESLAGDRIERVIGIVNGTTNYMLDQMDSHGDSYDQALAKAQELGYAEADPTADVAGLDAAAKCAILASLAFHTRVAIDDVQTAGITTITPADHADAHANGQVIKLLAVADRVSTEAGAEAVSVRVHPTLIPISHPLATVSGAFNAIVIEAAAAGRLMFYGQGAGGIQTASAVMSDVVAAAGHLVSGGSAPLENPYAQLPILDPAAVRSAYRIRLRVADEVGVLSHVTGVFAAAGVSIQAVVQAAAAGGGADLMVSTHACSGAQISELKDSLARDAHVHEVVQVLHMEGE